METPNSDMNGSPSPEVHHEPVKVEVIRWDFSGDGKPEKVEETRYAIFNNWAYRKVCKELGIDMREMQQEARKRQKQAAEEDTDPEDVQMERGEVADMLQVDVDDMDAMATLLWGSLLTQDPSLEKEEVEKWLTVDNLQYYVLKVVEALSYWMNGHADFDREAAEDIADEAAADAETGKETAGGGS